MDYIVRADTDFGSLAAYTLDVTELGTDLVRTDEFLPSGLPNWDHLAPVTERNPTVSKIRELLETLALVGG